MKKRWVLLSDIKGDVHSAYLENYKQNLVSHFEVQVYDIGQLAEIPSSLSDLSRKHRLFLEGGVSTAIHNLLLKEKETSCNVLAFSMGGYIAWKAVLEGLKVHRLILLSATRVRTEHTKPNAAIELYYGENDPFRPSPEWFKSIQLTPHLVPYQDHEFYRLPRYITAISNQLLT